MHTEEIVARQHKWDLRFLKLAADWSLHSKDPSTRTGAVVARPDLSIVALGYNGFPPGVNDDPARYLDRDLKYKLILHAEINAMDSAREFLGGYTLYTWPFMPCSRCTAQVIKRGIRRCVSPELPLSTQLQERWGGDLKLAAMMLQEAGVQLKLVPRQDLDFLGRLPKGVTLP